MQKWKVTKLISTSSVMKWVSTRRSSPPVPFIDALFAGTAPDGGLYFPSNSIRCLHRVWSVSGPQISPKSARLSAPTCSRARSPSRIWVGSCDPRSTSRFRWCRCPTASGRSSCFTVRRWRSRTWARACRPGYSITLPMGRRSPSSWPPPATPAAPSRRRFTACPIRACSCFTPKAR